MKILGIVGSMKKNGNTNALVSHCVDSIKNIVPDCESEIIYISEKKVQPCRVTCSKYCSEKPYQCSINDDVPAILKKMIEADALIIGAPLYVRVPSAHFHAFIERLISMFFFNECNDQITTESPLNNKPCGLIAVAEYSNPQQILEYLRDFCLLLKMKPVSLKKFPYIGASGQGEIKNDKIFKPFELSEAVAKAIAAEL